MSSSAPSLQGRPEAERRRIHDALVEVCREGGLGAATLEQVIARAAVDRAAFDRHFSDLDDCFAQYVGDACAPFTRSASTTAETTEDWRTHLRCVIYEMVSFWRADEARAHMLLVETYASGPLASLMRDQVLETMVDLIDQGRRLMDDPSTLTRLTAEALAGALFNQMHVLQSQNKLSEADRMVPQLMYFLVLPYLGVESAAAELSLSPRRES
jgi:AcrR family transcriptional regulator